MAAIYQNWLTDDEGRRLSDRRGRMSLDRALRFSASRVVNGIGWFSMELPPDFDETLLEPKSHNIVQIQRKPEGGSLSLWRPYFIRKRTFALDDDGNETVLVEGPDCMYIVTARIVASYAGLSFADKSGPIDNVMKAIVREAFQDSGNPPPLAGTTRAVSGFSVQADLGMGPTLPRQFAWDDLLTKSGRGILGGLAQASRQLGTEVFFDVVPIVGTGTISFEFRTKIGEPGRDVSADVTFAPEFGNLQDAEFVEDYTDEITYVYAAGRGQGTNRIVQQDYDVGRLGTSKFGRREAFAENTQLSSASSVLALARSALDAGKPVERLTATLVDTDSTRAGRDYDVGDRVTARYRMEFSAIVRAMTIFRSANGERIAARIDSED